VPRDEFRELHPISWALATVAEHAELLIHLEDEQRIQFYEQLGLPGDAIELMEQPSDENRQKLQSMIDQEWPEDPKVVYLGVIKGVIK
jgi:hypothetical protein